MKYFEYQKSDVDCTSEAEIFGRKQLKNIQESPIEMHT